MFVSSFIDWLMEKGILHPSHRWRREKLLHSLEETHVSHLPEQQSLADGATDEQHPSKPEPPQTTES